VFGAFFHSAVTLASLLRLVPSPVVVEVPFSCGQGYVVSQAHQTGSHLDNDAWAWDFRMPEGTVVRAAADGVVRLARGESTTGGCDEAYASEANYVVLSHGGGVETQYLHFQSVWVLPGERVRAGDVIGLSGETGWACGAHLHFKVAVQQSAGWNNPSLPARMRGYQDPEAGDWVQAPACGAVR
jgi:hypothetical protein